MASLKEVLKLVPKPLGKVTLCSGEPWEYEASVPRPVGRRWINRYPKLSQFVITFAQEMFPERSNLEELKVNETSVDIVKMITVMDKFFDRDEFMDDYVPAVFGLDSDDGRAYIEKFLEPTNIIAPFFEASMLIMRGHEENKSVEAAKKKSEIDTDALVVTAEGQLTN